MIKLQTEKNSQSGVLYVVPTPIGNLEDITLRALKILKSVDLIGAEDTRNTMKLLNHFDIHRPLTSYHEHSESSKISHLINQLQSGKKIAIVSDAGMPGISDPGSFLIQAAIAEEIDVVVLPGANAALCALVGSGLPTDQFYFYGFLPRKNKQRKEAWETLARQQATIILYESPYRLKATLKELKSHLGNRQIALGRELTKKFEEYIRGTVDDCLEWTNKGMVKGEFCIVIKGNPDPIQNESIWWEDLTLIEHVDHYINEDAAIPKDAIKQVAQDRRIPKRDVYQSYHIRD